ncbi:MAG: 3-deoxy-manno-octulosonate cytidylyltransferase, partial [Pirellulales bacterium]|nr:3-deoxy-manno-octulosonate cytidylyltransferase [Pirellulales bacterium]
MSSLVVIPARLASTRLPEKMLLAETGKPLVQHTYEAASLANKPGGVCVATDSQEIYDAVTAFGGHIRMTSATCASGTDRVAEVARDAADHDIFVNVQGDEPDLPATAIDQAIALLEADPHAVMSTLATPIRSRAKLDDPSCVKVTFDESGRALYFSRSAIPHARDWSDDLLNREPALFYQHVGLYAYRRDFLLQLAELA